MCGFLPLYARCNERMRFVRLRLLAAEQARHVCSVPGGSAIRTSLWRIQGFVSQTDQMQSVKCYHRALLKPS